MQRLCLQLGTINLMLLSKLKFWFIVTVDKDFWEKFILWKLYFIFQLWKVPIKSILFTGRSMLFQLERCCFGCEFCLPFPYLGYVY